MSDYTENAQKLCDALFARLIKKYPKQQELFELYCKQNYYCFDKLGNKVFLPAEPSITASEYNKYGRSSYGVTFNARINITGASLLGFTMDLYPECCALNQLNAFHSYDSYVDPDFADEFIEGCIRIYRQAINGVQRIMINFVESSRYGIFSTSDVIPVDEKSLINYPLFYKWANKYQTNETLFVNHNSARIIHNVVVNFADGVKK